jgi:hypothetical protein
MELGLLFVLAAAGIILLSSRQTAVVAVGAGYQGYTKYVKPKPKPKPKPKLVSRFNPKTTYRPIRGTQTKQGSQVRQQHERVVAKYTAAQAAARVKAAERAKVVAAQKTVASALNRPNLSLVNRKFLMMTNVALAAINRQVSLLAKPTPAAIQTIRTRMANALRRYGTALANQQSRPRIIPVAGGNALGLGDDPNTQTLSGGGGSGGFSPNTAQRIADSVGKLDIGTLSDAIQDTIVGEDVNR